MTTTTPKTPSLRVAVIGAGPSGLSCLMAFRSALTKHYIDEADLHLVCFEKQDDWGGMWNYTDLTGYDECGEPVHASMYKHMFCNSPKECSEYPDYSFDEHFGRPVPSYPPRPVVLDYLNGRASRANVRSWCRFRTPVRLVTYDEATRTFDVTAHDLIQDRLYAECFDYVIVATSHFSTPNFVQFDGWETFPGRYLHAHEFRNAEHYRNKSVLLVGGSYSAEDLALQCWKYGAKHVVISYRSAPIDYEWPDGIVERPLIVKIHGSTVTFKDGHSQDFDAIILCTGYQHHFPFLADDLRLKATNKLWVPNLYLGVVWESNPQLLYVGMQDQCYTLLMFDAQAWLARDVVLGRVPLPSRADMHADDLRWQALEDDIETEYDELEFSSQYIQTILPKTDYPKIDVAGIDKFAARWIASRDDDIVNYRDQAYHSLLTGTPATLHPLPWKDIRDDSLEAYMGAASSSSTTTTTDPNASESNGSEAPKTNGST